jgi:hypothetical protein
MRIKSGSAIGPRSPIGWESIRVNAASAAPRRSAP